MFEPWLFEQLKSTRRLGADTVIESGSARDLSRRSTLFRELQSPQKFLKAWL